MSMRRALVAEDSLDILFGLEMFLEQNDVTIVGAAATLDAVRKLAETVLADVAILDVNLNDEMVFPAADLLIAHGIPVIFTTGYEPDKIFPPRLLGMPALQKPYHPEELMRLVENAFAQSKGTA